MTPLIALVAAGCGPAAGKPATTPVSSTAPSATTTSLVLLDLTGTGNQKTEKFSAEAAWDVAWSYDCSALGKSGTFSITAFEPDGDFVTRLVDSRGASGHDVAHDEQQDTFYLGIVSDCRWHLTVRVSQAPS